MDSDKDNKDTLNEQDAPNVKDEDVSASTDQAPADALSRTPDELEEEKAERAAADTDLSGLDEEPDVKLSPAKKLFRKVNIYFLIFILLVVVAGAITIVNYLNSQKAPDVPDIGNQSLSEDALRQLANSDASVGASSQTLTIQGNAIIAGQTLIRGGLSVAGNIQAGGSLSAPNVTISGTSNLGTAQINSLQVASTTAIQGTTTLRDLNVAGTSSFSSAMTASQITVTHLIMSGNASLEIPNHISFTGGTPNRTFNSGILGTGSSGSVSGSDTAGTLNINSGNNPTTGCFMRITFQQAFPKTPRVIISPVGSAAGSMDYYVERDTTGFNICSSNTPQANKSFSFDYFVTY